MRPEKIQAWAEGVEFGHPPPVQPPFDEYGTPVFSYQDAKAYLNRIGKRVAEIAVLERSSPQQRFLLRKGEGRDLEVSGTQTGEAANTQKTELANTQKTQADNQDPEVYLNKQREILFQNRGAKDRKLVQKAVPFNPDREAYMNAVIKRQKEKAELERMTRQRKILFPNSIPKEDPKPELGPYNIPTRKPVPKPSDTCSTPKSNDTTPPPPQTVLLRTGETEKLENIPSYAERVRELGYPEELCPVNGAEVEVENTSGGDCMGAKVVEGKDDDQSSDQDQGSNRPGYTNGIHPPQAPLPVTEISSSPDVVAIRAKMRYHYQGSNRPAYNKTIFSSRDPFPAPESSLSPAETLALALRPAGTDLPNSMSRATIRDVVDLGVVSSSTRS